MAPQNFVFGLIGAEDLNIGGDTFPVTLPDGSVVPSYHKIGSHTLLGGVRSAVQNGCTGDGITDDSGELNTLANETLQPGGGVIFFPSPYTFRISTNIILPANVSLWFAPGATILVDDGKSVTIDGAVNADPRKTIFTGLGTVSITSLCPAPSKYLWWDAGTPGFTLNGNVANVLDFGAIADWDNISGTDNLPFFNAAIAALKANGGGMLIAPQANGGYWMDGTLEFDTINGLTFVMFSEQYNLDFEVPSKARLVFTGATDGVLITNCKGLDFINVQVDGVNVCTTPFIVDRMAWSSWRGTSVYRCPNGTACLLTSLSGVPNSGVAWCTFEDNNFEHVGNGFVLDGINNFCGVFHCNINNTCINYSGEAGLWFIKADNVRIGGTYFSYRNSGNGVPFRMDKTGSYYPSSISVAHLEGGGASIPIDAWTIDPGIPDPGMIEFLDQANGLVPPLIGDNSNLYVNVMNGIIPLGLRNPKEWRKGAVTVASVGTAGKIIRDDDCLGQIVFEGNGGKAYKDRLDVSGPEAAFIESINPNAAALIDVRQLTVFGEYLKVPLYPGAPVAGGAFQTNVGLYADTGAPDDAYGNDGDVYFRKDGTAAGKTVIYHRESGIWVPAVP